MMRAAASFVLGDRYRLVKLIGEGGMGVVWHAVSTRSGENRAIKFVREDAEPSSVARFVREAEALRGVVHPNVVRTYEVASEDGMPAIVMELLEGESLGERLERERVLSLGQTAAILGRVASAVGGAHAAGIVHRDLKPDNIFICTNGEEGDVRVLDFGVAKQLSSVQEKLTETGTLVGTPLYMSPEQAAGEKELDPRTDVWSLCVIAFECLTGTMPATGDNYGQVLARLIRGDVKKVADARPDLPRGFTEAVDAGLVERDRRPPLAELAEAFRTYADSYIEAPAPISATVKLTTAEAASFDPAITKARSLDVAPPQITRKASQARTPYVLPAIVLLCLALTAGTARIVVWIAAPSAATASAIATAPSPTSGEAAPAPVTQDTGNGFAPAVTVASARPPSAPMRPATSEAVGAGAPTTHGAPTPRARAAAAAPAAAAPSASEQRLQGGIGGRVPF
jgi:serine/threonine-protein kinase